MNYNKFLSNPSGIWGAMLTDDIPQTLLVTQELEEAVLKARRVLDVGCACGQLAFELNQLSTAQWLGLDVNEIAISKAVARDIPRAEFLVCDFLLPWNGQSNFDLVVINGVLTCLPSREQRVAILRNAARAVSSAGGMIYVSDFLQTWVESAHAARYEKGLALGLERGSFPVEGASGNVLYLAHHFHEDEFVGLASSLELNVSSFRVSRGITRSGKPIQTFTALIQ